MAATKKEVTCKRCGRPLAQAYAICWKMCAQCKLAETRTNKSRMTWSTNERIERSSRDYFKRQENADE